MSASGLSDDDDDKNDGLKWKLAESVRKRKNIFTASPLSSFSKFKTSLPPTGFIFYSQTGRMTDSIWEGGLGSGGGATTPPMPWTDSE
jgi:hypothetical protein